MSLLLRTSLLLTLSLLGPAMAQDKKPATTLQQEVATRDDAAAERLGFRLAVQSWTFRDRTACEAIETAHNLGLKYIELFPGQKLSPTTGDASVGVGMKDEHLQLLLKSFAQNQIKVVNFGVVDMPNDEPTLQALFAFGHALGIETFSCEPAKDAWPLVEKMCQQHSINAACHNHPKPSTYWNPETVLGLIKGMSNRVGACADTGHFPRSGLDPVQCLSQLKGRIISLHFKDIAPADKTGIDLPWGTGKSNARGQLEVLRQQGFRGAISIEYETGAGAELEANVTKCIAWFDNTCRAIETKAGK